MSARKGLYLNFWVDGYKLTPYSSNVEVETTADEIEAGAYDVAVKGYLNGRMDGLISWQGFFNKATAGSHAAMAGVATNKTAGVAYGNNASPGVGDIACAMPVHQSNYKVNSELDGVIVAEAQMKCRGTALEWGHLLANVSAVTASADLTSVDQAAGSSDGAAAYLFLTGVSAGDTLTVKVQDSPDNSTWTDLITFTLNGSAIGAERATVSGTVDRYVRVSYTISGTLPSFDFAVIFRRQ